MSESVICKTKRDGQIGIMDNGAVHTYVIAYEPGDFNADIPQEAVTSTLDRGSLEDGCIRPGDDQPMTIGWSAFLRDLGDTTGTYATLLDILNRYAGGYVDTNWVSTKSTSGVFTVTVTFTIDGAFAGEADKTLTFNFVSLRGGIAEGDPDTVTVSGTVFSVRPVLS